MGLVQLIDVSFKGVALAMNDKSGVPCAQLGEIMDKDQVRFTENGIILPKHETRRRVLVPFYSTVVLHGEPYYVCPRGLIAKKY